MPVLFILLVIIINVTATYSQGLANLKMMADGWSPWSPWQCSATCGGGYGRKARFCMDLGPNRCPGGKTKYGKCNEQPCPTATKPISNKGWTPWMPWECPVTCGGGKGTRTRICEDPDNCEGPEEQTGPCAEEPCPVDPDEVNTDIQREIDQQLKTSAHNFVVSQGETVVLPCKNRLAAALDGEYPNAKVTWVHNGELAKVDDKRIKLESGGDLNVKADIEDNGLWWCSVELTSKVSATVSFAAVGVQNEKPDITVEKGEAFELKCKAKSLSRLVKSRLDQRWIHNSTTFKELKGVKPESKDSFKISSSNYSSSGIWNCRYIAKGSNVPSREWVTNVTRVLVISRRSLLQKLLPFILATTICLVVIAVIGRIYWKRIKKKKLLEFEEEYEGEYGDEYGGYEEDEEGEPVPLFADRLNRKYS